MSGENLGRYVLQFPIAFFVVRIFGVSQPSLRQSLKLARPHEPIGLDAHQDNLVRRARARHAGRTARHQERDGWAAASAPRLSRRPSFFFMPPTAELLQPRGLVGPSPPPPPPRVHGVRAAVP